MRLVKKAMLVTALVSLMLLVVVPSPETSAQDGVKLPKSIYIQAQAMGQSTQLGRTANVTVIINEFSTVEDQKALIAAFNAKGNEGLVNALDKMHSKGRISITGTLGYDVNYIKKFPMPDGGVKLRLVTERPITFGEAWTDSRSSDYNLSGMEIIFSADKKKNSGVLFPACQFKLDKQNEIQIELLQNEWKLVNIKQR